MIIAADLHIGRKADAVNGSRVDDIDRRLRELLNVAHESRQTIVIAGDVFDRPRPGNEAFELLFDWLQQARYFEVPVILIPGNHDCSSEMCALDVVSAAGFNNVAVVSIPTVTEVDGVDVILAPHLTPKMVEGWLDEHNGSYAEYLCHMQGTIPDDQRAKVVIGHGMVRGLNYANDVFFEAARAMEFDAERLSAGGFETLILGHIHAWKHERKGMLQYFSPGSLVINHFGELTERKGYVTDYSGEWSWSEWTINTTPYRKIVMKVVDGEPVYPVEAVEAVIQAVEPEILKVVVEADEHDVVPESKIREYLAPLGQVLKFEVIRTGADTLRVSGDEVIYQEIGHEKLLEQWLEEADLPDNIKKIAHDIGCVTIAEVVNAHED